jgi:hypothetical protein
VGYADGRLANLSGRGRAGGVRYPTPVRDLADVLEAGSRIIEVTPPSADMAAHLAEHGHDRYLGLVAPEDLATIRRGAGAVAERFQPLHSPEDVLRNDADLLILRGAFVGHLWRPTSLDHLAYVAFDAERSLEGIEGRLALAAESRIGRMVDRGRYTCGPHRLRLAEVVSRRTLSARRYVSPMWGVEGLARRLQALGISYVVLRWFEDLPDLPPGEDLDILVRDEDLEKLRSLIAEEPGTIPVDIYSETGRSGSGYHGIAYYPPSLARRLLDRSVPHASGFEVPAPDDHLHSLAYHALYHKGLRSGLPSRVLAERDLDPEHDYGSVLQELATAIDVELPMTLEEVDEYLGRRGWRPPRDALVRLSTGNRWIRERFVDGHEDAVEPPETAVFVLRDRARAVLSTDEVIGALDHYGFEVLEVADLEPATRERCAAEMRGGNWGRGPYPESGGEPSSVVVAVHYGPRRPDAELADEYPHLSNVATLEAKVRIRDLVNERLEPARHCNPIHSSDNEREAWSYIELTLPSEVADLAARVHDRRAEYRTDVPVLEELGRGRRAKVELVQHDDGVVVRKTYGRGYVRHMRREVEALTRLGPRIGAVPELLAAGDNWFCCPYYEDELAPYWGSGRLLPLATVREMVEVLRAIHEQGYALIDAKPGNFMLDRRRGLKIIDFEFLHRYPGEPPPFRESYSFVGVPVGFEGDVPVGPTSYGFKWLKYTGLSLDALLDAPRWSQHLERTIFRMFGTVVDERVPMRTLRAALIRRRSRLGTRARLAYAAWARWRQRQL